MEEDKHPNVYIGNIAIIGVMTAIIAAYYSWLEWGFPRKESHELVIVFFALCMIAGIGQWTDGMIKTARYKKMGLFKRIGRSDKVAEEIKFEVIDSNELMQSTTIMTNHMELILSKYNRLIDSNHQLSLFEYRELMKKFKDLAQGFEKIYEVMGFDMEKLEEIEKYNQKSYAKRIELLEQLNSDSNAKTENSADKQPKK